MPYDVKKVKGKEVWHVIDRNTGEIVGRSTDERDAHTVARTKNESHQEQNSKEAQE